MASKFMLCSFKTCPWVQRAAIVLRAKKIEYDINYIDRDNRPEWFLKVSPHSKVPVLVIDGKESLFESNAIAEYLDETAPPRLHPEDPLARARNRAWTDYVPDFAEAISSTAYSNSEEEFAKNAAGDRQAVRQARRSARPGAATTDPTSTARSSLWWTRPMRRSCSATPSWTA